MRPVRIRAEGFSAFRSEVQIDLAEVDFFSLSGPTGSGKSSLVDAMIFALFGRVPRLGGNAVAPAITAGADRARVAFDFEMDGSRYTAVRLAARTKSGASVREARLQAGDKVLADGADDVTRAVEELLRLRYEDFIRTVVLPQGEFARFLTATRSERQGLLRNLLGLEVYAAVRGLAKTRETVARERSEFAGAQLAGLELPDEDAIAAAHRRLSDLGALGDSIVEREAALTESRDLARRATAEVERIDGALARLGRLEPPSRLEELDHDLAAAREAVDRAGEVHEQARVRLRKLEDQRAALPTAEAVRVQLERHHDLTAVADRIEALGLDTLRGLAANRLAALEKARERAGETAQMLEAARSAHSAHALRSALKMGEPCPVCLHEVGELVDLPAPTGFEALLQRHDEAESALALAAAAEEEARLALTRAETTGEELETRRSELIEALEGAPGVDRLAEIETELSTLADEIAAVSAAGEEAAAEERRLRVGLEDLAESVRSVGRHLMAARQSVADLEPPLPESDEPIVQWKELMSWSDQASAQLLGLRRDAADRAATTNAEWVAAGKQLMGELEALGVAVREPHAVEVTRELQSARSAMEAMERTLAEAEKLERLIVESNTEAAVAGALAGHLKADGFERWLMVGAMTELVTGANGLLAQLSDGGYSLHSDQAGSFSIVDHRNADEIRPVSTLSGGETFLVSLALALSLAETLAVGGGARLDAIILDEGFGTLDDESLDTVSTILEELSGDGLMVGVITHVKELASRAPVRYEVARGPTGSVVELVS